MKHLLISAAILFAGAAFAQQPYVGCWHPEDIRDWSPEKDANAVFNRAKVPLAKRVAETAPMKANSAQQYGGQITDATILHPMCSVIPSQGAYNFVGYQPTYWQYMDKLVHWAGSASEGIIIPPPAGTVDAAHAQGVKVLGQLFFPPTAFGGKSEWVNQILTKENGKFIYAQKLYDIAKYCGFDGWFLNEETNHGTSSLWPEFVKEFNAIADADGHPEMEIQWYNASLVPNTSILGAHPNTSQFLEYGSAGNLTSWADKITYADGSHPKDIFSILYAGIEVSQAGHTNYGTQLRKVFPTTGHVGSVALFCPEERTWKDNVRNLLNTSDAKGEKAWDAITKTFANEEAMWVNGNGDPSQVPASGFPGISGAIVERSAITSAPFLSYMSVGVGKHRFINGKKEATADWYHSGMQSVLPTWRWWIENAPGVKAAIDWDDAWNGPSSFKLSGSLTSGSHLLRLYKTAIPVGNGLTVRVYYKSEVTPVLQLSTAESLTPDMNVAASEVTDAGGWKCATYPVSSSDKTIHLIALDLKADTPISDFSFSLGGISVLTDNLDTSLTYDNLATTSKLGVEEGDLRLTWTSDWTPAFDRFDIYVITMDGTRSLAGQTRDDAYYIPLFERPGNDAYIDVEVVPVMIDGTEKTPMKLRVDYPEPAAPEVNITISKSYITVGENVTLTAKATGAPDSFAWTLCDGVEFAEGYTASSNPVMLTALTSGEKEIRVEATNSIGTGSLDIVAFDVFKDAEDVAKVHNVALNKEITAYSSMTNFRENPENILDGVTSPSSASDKWCSTDNDNYVCIDLGKSYRIYGVKIYDGNYGPESGVPQIASYKVTVIPDLDGAASREIINRKNVADLSMKEDYCAPIEGRYIRLDTHTDGVMRMWEFEVYGKSDGSGVEMTEVSSQAAPVAYYTPEGIRTSGLQPGINIVVYSDGSVRRILHR